MNVLNTFPSLRKFENLHILLWLIKDSCWMLEIRWLGTLMIIPTVSVAVWITWVTRGTKDLYINLAVFFWITANSAWMIMEFYYKEEYKLFTALPFCLGFICVFNYYYRSWREKSSPDL